MSSLYTIPNFNSVVDLSNLRVVHRAITKPGFAFFSVVMAGYETPVSFDISRPTSYDDAQWEQMLAQFSQSHEALLAAWELHKSLGSIPDLG